MTNLATDKIGNGGEDISKKLIIHDLAFQAIQISQIMVLECEVLKDNISNGDKQSATEIINSLQGHAISIGKMMQELRKPAGK